MEVDLFFPSAVARGSHPEFLHDATVVLDEYIAQVDPNQWNVCQSAAMFDDRLKDLLQFIARTSFEMLAEQGYDMQRFRVSVTEFWGQQFTRHGQHIEHVHSLGAQITGFYFVSVPENSSHPVIFDPRPAKRQINLPQANAGTITYASDQIHFQIKPGDLILFNSWMSHGFFPHNSDEPFKFIHFNVGVDEIDHMLHNCQSEVEIV
jgi:uncharacterized protein (TIGR02466 family)